MQASNLIPRGRGSRGRGRGFRLPPTNDQECNNPQTPSMLPLAELESQYCDDMSSGLQNLQLDSESDATKENFDNLGKNGEACQCLTNFVKLRRTSSKSVFEYRLTFAPPLESTKLKKTLAKQLENVVGPVTLFDGETLYLPIKLPVAPKECTVKHPNNEAIDVVITIKFIQERTSPSEFTQFYNILFQRIMLNLGYLEIRRGFYKVSEVRELNKAKLQIWPGIIPTVQMKDDGLMVMIDFPSRVLRMETIHDFYIELRKKEQNEEKFRKNFSEFVIGKIVVCRYSLQCHKIDDITFEENPTGTFIYRDRKVTYCEYFKMQYNIEIQDLTQPLLLSRIKPRKVCHPSKPTEAVRVICLIPELCNLTGLTSEQRANRELVTEISAITKLNPRLKASAMGQLLKEITESSTAKEFLKNWGLKLDTELVATIGRKIPPPALSFYENSEPRVVQPNFSKEASKSCVHPMPVTKFVVICEGRDYEASVNFLTEYGQACAILGIKLRTNGEIVRVNNRGNTLNQFVRALEKSCTDDVQFVVTVLPTHRDDLYRAVKKFCCSIRPIPSQCVLAKNLRQPKILKRIVVNICLQINCKIGGSLWSLRMPFTKKVMVIGMDAAHDPTRKNPSVIALVATLNQKCTLHFSRCALQPVHQEICTSLRVMFKDALDAYRKYNADELPDKIVFYRDGGSAGTFQTLKNYEIDICLKVLEEETVGREKATNFSYLCVAKRIPQRILLMSEGRTITNPKPGTVLDHTITEPSRYDFYIVSQQVREGTVNPTHYSVIHETKRTKPDDMQRLAYAMTYMYYNFAGSIKVPSVIQYSHKLGQLVSRIQEIPNRNICHTLYFL